MVSSYNWPIKIVVIGGGRWAKVIISVLYKLVSLNTNIYCCTFRNVKGIEWWAKESGYNQLNVFSSFSDIKFSENFAVIIANSAKDHESFAKLAIKLGAAVLVEKPVALDFVAVQNLSLLAEKHNTYLAAAHTFMFARYFFNFSTKLKEMSKINEINFIWADSINEKRYEDFKTFDSGLPIYIDCLPHVLTILETIISPAQIKDWKFDSLKLDLGGSSLELLIYIESIPCNIQLIRNSNNRKRFIHIKHENSESNCDFSIEPPELICDGRIYDGDPDWKIKSSPLESLLISFLNGAVTSDKDDRLDIKNAFHVAKLIDDIRPIYLKELKMWLIKTLGSNNLEYETSLKYAYSELLELRVIETNLKISDLITMHLNGNLDFERLFNID